MTKFQPLDLRPQGQAWPGLNTRGGFLSNGTGQLADGSFNGVIERGDVLRKRRGLIRGLDERFVGVVCGLFKYTDECGVEYLLVTDQEGIKIREPFEIPVFTVSDAYPNDTFSSTGAPNALNWRNTSRYTQTSDTLVLLGSAAPSLAAQVPSTSLMRWFKDAANPSYEVQVQYEFDGSLSTRQRVSVVLRGSGDLQRALSSSVIWNEHQDRPIEFTCSIVARMGPTESSSSLTFQLPPRALASSRSGIDEILSRHPNFFRQGSTSPPTVE